MTQTARQRINIIFWRVEKATRPPMFDIFVHQHFFRVPATHVISLLLVQAVASKIFYYLRRAKDAYRSVGYLLCECPREAWRSEVNVPRASTVLDEHVIATLN